MFKIIFLIFLPFYFPLSAQQPEEIFKEANRLYQSGNYYEAIENYELLVQQDFNDADLFYNLGNAYYREGQLGMAILYYEKALKLKPGSEDIKHNLAIVNSKVVDKVERLPGFFLFEWWENLLALFTISGWTIAAYTIFILLLFFIGLYYFARSAQEQKIFFYSSIAASALLVLTILLLAINLNRELKIKNGVVVNTSVTVKQSPDPLGSNAFIIHEGLKISVEDNLDEWVKIKIPDGKTGWIKKNNIRII